MAKMTIKQQQIIIDEFKKIINRICTRYKLFPYPMPDYQKLYIESLQEQIQERQEWIANQKKESEG